MEPFGLAAGAAGLVGLFTTCLQLYDIIDAGKKSKLDYEILKTKLGLERVRLLLWGEKVGLVLANRTSPRLDPRLEDQRISSAVWDILGCMKMLFEDTESLRQKYGLKETKSSAVASQESNVLMATFKDSYRKLQAASESGGPLRAKAKWAISDKARFIMLIDDIRGFNDSLAAMFPDIAETTRASMRSDIHSLGDARSLRIIEGAASGYYDDFSETASTRLTQVTHSGRSSTRSMSSGSVLSAFSSRLNRLLAREEVGSMLERRLDGMSKGALFLRLGNMGDEVHSYMAWTAIDNDEERFLQHSPQYPEYPYLAWKLHHAFLEEVDIEDHNGYDYTKLDPESSKLYLGTVPGTVSRSGFTAEFTRWKKENAPPKSVVFLTSTAPAPTIPMQRVVARLAEQRSIEKLSWMVPGDQLLLQITEFVGEEKTSWSDSDFTISGQLSLLFRWLNRSDLFDDMRDIQDLGSIMSPQYIQNLWQLLLAYEALLRLRTKPNTSWNITQRVIAAMEASERWRRGVRCHMEEGKLDLNVFSLVEDRQVEGMLRFAETLNWPYQNELRDRLENTYTRFLRGEFLKVSLRDWIFGAVFPGGKFSDTIMSAMVLATEPLKDLWPPPWRHMSLVLPNQSYWRSNTALGRVLAAIKGTKCVLGWVGPCPPVESPSLRSWVFTVARPVGFTMPNYYEHPLDEAGEFIPSADAPLPGERTSRYVRNLFDRSRWSVPAEPAQEHKYRCTLKGIRLDVSSDGKDMKPAPASSSALVTYRASLDILVDAKLVQFTLYSNPLFISAAECFDGPHLVHERDIAGYKDIRSVRDLKNQRAGKNKVLVINATCEGGELVARAWCAENMQHAVVRRVRMKICFGCAIKMAGNEGLGVGCLIWA